MTQVHNLRHIVLLANVKMRVKVIHNQIFKLSNNHRIFKFKIKMFYNKIQPRTQQLLGNLLNLSRTIPFLKQVHLVLRVFKDHKIQLEPTLLNNQVLHLNLFITISSFSNNKISHILIHLEYGVVVISISKLKW